MRFLIVNSDYPAFLKWLYRSNPAAQHGGYQKQLESRHASLFGVSDFYSSNLSKLGHEAHDVYINNPILQAAWAREHGLKIRMRRAPRVRLRSGFLPWPASDDGRAWMEQVLAAQIEELSPDVILNQDMQTISGAFLAPLKVNYRMLIGQHAASPVTTGVENHYDLVLSSFPPTVDRFRELGVKAELHRLAFEPRVLERVASGPRIHDVTFVGSLMSIHSTRQRFLERLATAVPSLSIWTPDKGLPQRSTIRRRLRGEAWGRDMYEVLAHSRITLNHHGDVPSHSNNLRLYEATGVGALLLTDWTPDLQELFRVGEEVVAYKDAEEAIGLIRHFLEDEARREQIAHAGQARTIKDHSWTTRMEELLRSIERYS